MMESSAKDAKEANGICVDDILDPMMAGRPWYIAIAPLASQWGNVVTTRMHESLMKSLSVESSGEDIESSIKIARSFCEGLYST